MPSSSQERVVAVIPARMGSSRFPGKPLTPIKGRSMVEHVYKRVALCQRVDEGVYIATPDNEIARVVEDFGGQVIMTSPSHQRASDRVAEVAESMEADIFVLIQGDEPMVVPAMIDGLVVDLLGRHVLHGSDQGADVGLQRSDRHVAVGAAGNSKVDNLGLTA